LISGFTLPWSWPTLPARRQTSARQLLLAALNSIVGAMCLALMLAPPIWHHGCEPMVLRLDDPTKLNPSRKCCPSKATLPLKVLSTQMGFDYRLCGGRRPADYIDASSSPLNQAQALTSRLKLNSIVS
jgi:hypothetical protein